MHSRADPDVLPAETPPGLSAGASGTSYLHPLLPRVVVPLATAVVPRARVDRVLDVGIDAAPTTCENSSEGASENSDSESDASVSESSGSLSLIQMRGIGFRLHPCAP